MKLMIYILDFQNIECGFFDTLALILSRKLSFLNKICVTTVIIKRYGLRNDSGCHLNDA